MNDDTSKPRSKGVLPLLSWMEYSNNSPNLLNFIYFRNLIMKFFIRDLLKLYFRTRDLPLMSLFTLFYVYISMLTTHLKSLKYLGDFEQTFGRNQYTKSLSRL